MVVFVRVNIKRGGGVQVEDESRGMMVGEMEKEGCWEFCVVPAAQKNILVRQVFVYLVISVRSFSIHVQPLKQGRRQVHSRKLLAF